MRLHRLFACVVLAASFPLPPLGAAGTSAQALGLQLLDLDEEDLDEVEKAIGRRAGVVVTEVQADSAAARAGLQMDDLIVAVGGTNVASSRALDEALGSASGAIPLTVVRWNGERPESITLTIAAGGAPAPEPRPPQPPGPAPPPGNEQEIRAKLDALEKARAAGVISEEEYRRKRAVLEAGLAPRPADPETQRKLAALKAALDAGILTREEYDRKCRELTGGAAAPEDVSWHRDERGRFRFRIPEGWQVQSFPDGQGLLAQRGEAGITLLLAPSQGGRQAILDSMMKQIRGQCREYKEMACAPRTIAGLPAASAEFTGINPRNVRTRTQVHVIEQGESGFLFIVDVPEGEFAATAAARETLLGTFALGGAGGGSQVYRHPMGFSFEQPDGWTVESQEQGLRLRPRDEVAGAGGPEEGYHLSAGAFGPGTPAADESEVVQICDSLVKARDGALQITGRAQDLDVPAGRGWLFAWSSRAPQGAGSVARGYICIAKDYYICLLAVGRPDLLDRRDADLRKLCRSLSGR